MEVCGLVVFGLVFDMVARWWWWWWRKVVVRGGKSESCEKSVASSWNKRSVWSGKPSRKRGKYTHSVVF